MPTPDAASNGKCCERDHDGDGNCDRHPAGRSADHVSWRRRWAILRDRIRWWIRKHIASAAAAQIRLMRRLLRWTGSRCSWCGRDCGLNSSISAKGMRCAPYDRDCERMP